MKLLGEKNLFLIFLFWMFFLESILAASTTFTVFYDEGVCSSCLVCGGCYTCSTGSFAGPWNDGIRSFSDPIGGNRRILRVDIRFNGVVCGSTAATYNWYLNGQQVGSAPSPPIDCSCGTCSGRSFTGNSLSSFSNYNFGGINSFQFESTDTVCVQNIAVTIIWEDNCPCVNGYCNSQSQCICYGNWAGSLCDRCATNWYDSQCSSYCNPAVTCNSHGQCDTNGDCQCSGNWDGPSCSYCKPNYFGSNCDVFCGPNCVNGFCNSAGQCVCETGWTGSSCDTCDLANDFYPDGNGNCIFCSREVTCNNQGNCNSTGRCECGPGYSGPNCNNLECKPACQFGTCTEDTNLPDPVYCDCNSNWYGDACNVYCEPTTTCNGHGSCRNDGSCQCESFWSVNPDCSVPLCDRCENGQCVLPFTCECDTNFYGSNCDIFCESNTNCSGNGDCTQSGTCGCLSGWGEDDCSKPICDPDCNSGDCVAPDSCDCSNTGYTGDNCEIPVCSFIYNGNETDCQNGGNCTAPNVCSCDEKYSGRLCAVPLCFPECVRGFCSAPGICTCDENYYGINCDTFCEVNTTCSGNGKCNTRTGFCECDEGWAGSEIIEVTASVAENETDGISADTFTSRSCFRPICSPACEFGECIGPGTCLCQPNYYGKVCDTYCDANTTCSGNGVCNENNGVCQCESGFFGEGIPTTVAGNETINDTVYQFSYNHSIQCYEFSESKTKNALSTQNIGIISGAGGVLLICALSSFIALIIIKKKRNEKQVINYSVPMELLESMTLYDSIPTGLRSSIDSDRRERMQNLRSSIELDWEINVAEISFENELGRGAYGVVYRGVWRGLDVAVKKIMNTDFSEESLNLFIKECELMRNLRPHKHVVQLLGMVIDPPCIVTAYYSNGSLFDFLMSDAKIDVWSSVKIMKGIALGMSHLSHEGVVHRDLASRNILLDDSFEAVVSDFGLSRVVADSNKSAQTQSEVGPLKWMAPESLTQQRYSIKSDVWSFGVTCWEIFARAEPFPEMDALTVAFAVGRDGQRLEVPHYVPEGIQQIIYQCWETEPESRPDFDQIVGMITNLRLSDEDRSKYF